MLPTGAKMARLFSTGRCLSLELNGPPRIGSKGKHLPPSHMRCIGEMVRKQRARPEVMVRILATGRALSLFHIKACDLNTLCGVLVTVDAYF